MMTVTQSRQALADALNALTGVTMTLREPKNGRPGDGWTAAGELRPESFTTSMVDLKAVILLSADYVKADELFDNLATAAMNAATKNGLGTADVRVEPGIVPVGDTQSPMYALIVNASMEVQ